MTSTSPLVSFGLYNLEIKQDSTPGTTSALQSFSKVDDLRTDATSGRPYATYEPDFWLLDGNYKFLPSDEDVIHVGMMSLDMSDAAGDMATPPVLTLDFAAEHSIDSLTLHFSRATGDYARSIRIAYYNADTTLIRQDDYAPGSVEFTTGQEVSNFKRIVITFYATSRPYRYLRLMGIDYGELITFSGTAVRAAAVIEDTDPISGELRGNSLTLRLYSADGQFNLFNPDGHYAALKAMQPLLVYELVDEAPVFIGQYYLDTWENTSDTEIEFTCVDLIGLMGKIPYRGGWWTGTGTPVQDLLDSIMTAAGIPYELDPALYDLPITGWLPDGMLREALQQIAFAIGAAVDCSRSWVVKIYRSRIASAETSSLTITRAQKGTEQSVALRPLIAGVEVTAHTYLASTTTQELYNGSLAAGEYEILFTQPMHTLSVTGAAIKESGANYAVLTVSAAGTVTLSGCLILDTPQVYPITNPDVTGSIKTTPRVTDATLVNADNVADVAQRLYDYHTQRYLQKLTLYAAPVEVGQVVNVETLYDRQMRGVIERLDIDLAGGMVVKAKIVGVEAD